MTDRIKCKCGTKFCKHNKAQVWSCGGETQSCAIAALIVQGKLPKPDFSVIADTGRECQTTWDYCDGTLIPELKKVGVDLVRIKAEELGYNKTDVFTWNGGELLIPAFTTDSGKGKLSNFCTSWWKQDIITRYLAQQGVMKSWCCKWIGFSRDEQRRIIAMQNGEDFKNGGIRFPLLEVVFSRRESINFVIKTGWPLPPRSRCWMCPNQGDHEWRELKDESPEEFQRAVEWNEKSRNAIPTLGCTSHASRWTRWILLNQKIYSLAPAIRGTAFYENKKETRSYCITTGSTESPLLPVTSAGRGNCKIVQMSHIGQPASPRQHRVSMLE